MPWDHTTGIPDPFEKIVGMPMTFKADGYHIGFTQSRDNLGAVFAGLNRVTALIQIGCGVLYHNSLVEAIEVMIGLADV